MSCARRRANLEDPNGKCTGIVVEQAINQGVNRLLQLHEHFIETQNLAVHNQVQTIAAEHTSLQALLESQHQELLQKLCGREHLQELSVQEHQGEFVRQSTPKSDNTGLESSRTGGPDAVALLAQETSQMLMRGLPFSATAAIPDEYEILDLSKLPLHWVTQQELQDSAAKDESITARIRHLVRTPAFDLLSSGILIVNIVSMCIELEWRAYQVAELMGDRENDNGFEAAKGFFQFIEVVFAMVYLAEFLLRVYVFGRSYFTSFLNICDSTIVLLSLISTCVLEPMGVQTSNFAVARIIRLSRVVRFMKVGRFAHAFTELRILARALLASLQSLYTAFLLLLCVILSGALLLFQVLVTYIEDENNPREQREWVYKNFGSVTLAVMAMWEVTFTGSWHRYSRQLILEINGYLSIFWVFYIIAINFAVMRLIGALFLKQTLTIAATDAEKTTMIQLKEKQRFASQIREVFIEADTSGDGKISPSEFEQMVYDPKIGKCFESLGLEVAEVATLFQLLMADDGQADYEEFLEGAMKLKNSAKTIDVIQLLHANMTVQKQVEMVYDKLCNTPQLESQPLNVQETNGAN